MTEAEIPSGRANAGDQQGNRFQKGQSGNPHGRAEGSRNKASFLLDRLAEDGAEAIQKQVIEAAKGGDLKAAELILARIWPPRRGRPVHIDLPAVRTTREVSDGMAAVVEALAAGEVTPEEAATISGVLEARRKALETHELAARVDRLEQEMKSR
jgi:hypothetical protein